MTDNEIITIDDAISHCYETYFERDDLCRECREEHKQLAKWLEELKESRNTINRQKAEIERLNGEVKEKTETIDFLKDQVVGWNNNYCELKTKLKTAKADKVIAERHEKDARDLFKGVVGQLAVAKSEAIKDFAERLCKGRVSNDPVVIAVRAELKEMDGGEE